MALVTGGASAEDVMRWEDFRSSGNVEDRRGMSGGRAGGIGIGTLIDQAEDELALAAEEMSTFGGSDDEEAEED